MFELVSYLAQETIPLRTAAAVFRLILSVDAALIIYQVPVNDQSVRVYSGGLMGDGIIP